METLLRLLTESPQAERERLTSAYEAILRSIGLVDRDDPVTAMIAKRVVQVAQSGVGPAAISEQVIRELTDRR